MFGWHRQSLVVWLVVCAWIHSTTILLLLLLLPVLPVVTSLTSAHVSGFLPISVPLGQKVWSPLPLATTKLRHQDPSHSSTRQLVGRSSNHGIFKSVQDANHQGHCCSRRYDALNRGSLLLLLSPWLSKRRDHSQDQLHNIITPSTNTSIQTTAKLLAFGTFLCVLLFKRAIAPSMAWASVGGGATTTAVSTNVASNVLSFLVRLFQSIWTTLYTNQQRMGILKIGILALNFCALTAATIECVTTARRQASDATSEWARYAKSPSARGRAIVNLVAFRLVPIWFQLWILHMKSSLCRNSNSGMTKNNTSTRLESLHAKQGRILADGLLRLGPLYIKMGQIVSCREGLMPPAVITALERLQDQVPAQSGQRARELAYATWPGGRDSFDATFANVDWTPIAAASLGQVHRATLRRIPNKQFINTNTTRHINDGHDGNIGAEVAVKLQRPYLKEIYNQDFALLTSIAGVVDRWFGSSAGSMGGVTQSWTDIFAGARTIMYREIDYRAEAENGLRFGRDFGFTVGGKPAVTDAVARDGKALPSAASWLRAPYVYAHLSTEQVLVMEYVPSIKITDNKKLNAANVMAADKEYLADCLGRSYLRQFCCNKFFSTDPHAGNLGVEILNMNSKLPQERVRLVFYDFGQVAELQQNQANGILNLIEAIVDMDVDRSIESFLEMGVLKEGADLVAVKAKVADNYRTGNVKANRKKLKLKGYKLRDDIGTTNDLKVNSTESSDAQVMQSFTLPAEYAFVGRALSQMDGVGKSLDADFDFVSTSAPWLYEIKGAGVYLKDEALKWISNLFVPFR